MKLGFHDIHGHNDLWNIRIYDVGIAVSIPTSRCDERPYRCHVAVRSTCRALIDWLRSLTSADRTAFAVRFLTKDHPNELPMIQIEQGSTIIEMLCPWKGGERDFFLATLAVVDRYENHIPDHIDIQIEPVLFSRK